MLQEKWSPLTENLFNTLQEITNECDSTFTPSVLLDSLRKKCKMFIGYSQHDSHELLRHLLDSVRDDDLKVNLKNYLFKVSALSEEKACCFCTYE